MIRPAKSDSGKFVSKEKFAMIPYKVLGITCDPSIGAGPEVGPVAKTEEAKQPLASEGRELEENPLSRTCLQCL